MELLTFIKMMLSIKQIFSSLISNERIELKEITLNDLERVCAAPFRSLPNFLDRNKAKPSTGINLILGGSGTGKTRQGFELVKSICEIHKVDRIYYYSGFISRFYRLTFSGQIKNVIVFIDDFDLQKTNIGSLTINENPRQFQSVLDNISTLYKHLIQSVDVVSFVVTINTQRVEINKPELEQESSNISVCELNSISQSDFDLFIETVIEQYNIEIANEIKLKLKGYCDGRLSTIATFLNCYVNSKISDKELLEYEKLKNNIWQLFKNRLSAQKLLVYDTINLLLDYNLKPRLQYIYHLLKNKQPHLSKNQIKYICNNLWEIKNSEVIVFKSQFNKIARTEDETKKVLTILKKTGNQLNRSIRYDFQEEVKYIVSRIPQDIAPKEYFELIKKAKKWYSNDKYFAFLLAHSLKEQKRYFKAIRIIYRALNKRDVIFMYSGKWIEIRLHLLLAELFSLIEPRYRHWKTRVKIEKEYIIAEEIANLGIDDIPASGFAIVLGNKEKGEESFSNYISELGYKLPSDKLGEVKELKELVHNHYLKYLKFSENRFFDMLYHLDILISLNSSFSYYYKQYATVCLSIGDSITAVKYLEKAKIHLRDNKDRDRMNFYTNYEFYRAYANLGNEIEAKKYLKKCIAFQESGGITGMSFDLNEPMLDDKYWKGIKCLNDFRNKKFNKQCLKYTLLSLDLHLEFPDKWIIQDENCGKMNNNIVVSSIFSSPVIWSEKSKVPSNASISFYWSKFEIIKQMFLTPPNKKNKQEVIIEDKKLNSGLSYSKCNFIIDTFWPKKGYKLLFQYNDSAFLIQFMSEEVSLSEFLPVFEKMENNIINQLEKRTTLPKLHQNEA